ncbi:MAG: hypothetical protein ABT940_15030, partial [Alphaproteobacteria bacterium]
WEMRRNSQVKKWWGMFGFTRPPPFFNLGITMNETQPKLFISTPMYGGQCYGYYAQSILMLQKSLNNAGVETTFSFMFNESLITSFGSEGWEFESLRARHRFSLKIIELQRNFCKFIFHDSGINSFQNGFLDIASRSV